MSHTISSQPQNPKLERAGIMRIFVVLAYLGGEALVLFLAAGRLDWPAAWIYFGLRLGTLLTVGLWVARKSPELINARGRPAKNTKPWDKVIMLLYTPLIVILPLVAGLDARFGWSAVARVWQIVGFVGLIPGMLLPYWAMVANRFLVTTARIQAERGHAVVSSGPYRFVRHPMYVGAILLALCAPLLLGSWWALVPGGLTAVLILVRTALEDRMLHAELPGYADYAQRVRYRLLPGVW